MTRPTMITPPGSPPPAGPPPMAPPAGPAPGAATFTPTPTAAPGPWMGGVAPGVPMAQPTMAPAPTAAWGPQPHMAPSAQPGVPPQAGYTQMGPSSSEVVPVSKKPPRWLAAVLIVVGSLVLLGGIITAYTLFSRPEDEKILWVSASSLSENQAKRLGITDFDDEDGEGWGEVDGKFATNLLKAAKAEGMKVEAVYWYDDTDEDTDEEDEEAEKPHIIALSAQSDDDMAPLRVVYTRSDSAKPKDMGATCTSEVQEALCLKRGLWLLPGSEEDPAGPPSVETLKHLFAEKFEETGETVKPKIAAPKRKSGKGSGSGASGAKKSSEESSEDAKPAAQTPSTDEPKKGRRERRRLR